MNVGNREQYLTISSAILQDEGLTLIEKMLLGRIAGFEQYFESNKSCADMMGVSEDTIRKAKSKLEKNNYIELVKNTGHGKVYKALSKWKVEKSVSESPIETAKSVNTQQTTTSHPEFSSSTAEKTMKPKKLNKQWDKTHSDLIDVRDRAISYLRNNGIPVDIGCLQTGISRIEETFPNLDASYLLNSYIDYLESPAYVYQVEHNQYCPTIKTTSEFCDKFSKIRAFKTNKKQHYDPSKVLTTY